MKKPKVVAIVGPTASGKTSLSISLAKTFAGEVISADSRQVYRGMDLGTGKVTSEEMAGVPHHLLDIADPMEIYTGADFKRDGTAALEDVLKRGRTPFVAGGSFFYLDLLRDKSQSAAVEPNETLRISLETLSNATLHEQLYRQDPARAATIDRHNRRRLIRALEIVAALGQVPPIAVKTSPYNWLVIGIDIDKNTLHSNIEKRLHERMSAGMKTEVEQLLKNGVTPTRLDALGLEYRYITKLLQGELTESEMLETLNTKIRQFAKRQMTWLRRDEEIEWFAPENHEVIFRRVKSFLEE